MDPWTNGSEFKIVNLSNNLDLFNYDFGKILFCFCVFLYSEYPTMGE